MKRHLLFYLCSFLSLSILNLQAQPNTLVTNAKPGSCYAKCLIDPGSIEMTDQALAVYIGMDEPSENDNIKLVSIATEGGSTKWEKKNEKYELAVEDSEQQEIVMVVKDTTLGDEYIMENFSVIKDSSDAAFAEWRAVVCEQDITKELIEAIQEKLTSLSFYQGEIDGRNNEFLKKALANYQREIKLPIGSFNHETLTALNIPIPN